MSKKARQPTARLPVEGWIVYIVQCADGSFYTGITKDVVRRCQQHNAGTASRYTRSRGPVKLVYQEDHPDQSSALKREAAIKAMDRRGKLTMVKQSKPPAKAVRQIARLEDIPNVGPAVAGDLRQLGITSPGELPGRDPYALYDDLCRITGQRHDLCMLDTFIAAVRYMEGAPKRPWWKYTAERKQEMTARREARPGTMMPSLCEPARTSGRSASHGPGSCSVSCPPRTPLTRSTRPSRSFSATATVPGTMPKRASRVIGTKPVDGRDGPGKAVAEMLPLYHDPHFTFRFADDRIIPRFHLEGVEAGRRVAVYKIDPDSGERLGLLAMAGVGEGGWVDLPEPITVRAGDAFIAVPDSPS